MYPKIEKNRLEGSVVENEQPLVKDDQNLGNKFEDLEFRGFYNLNNPFVVISEEAIIEPENPDIFCKIRGYGGFMGSPRFSRVCT